MHRKTLLQNLRNARNAAGLKQKDFAEVIGVHPVTISRWETGEIAVSLDTVEHYAQATYRPVWWFFKEDTEQTNGTPPDPVSVKSPPQDDLVTQLRPLLDELKTELRAELSEFRADLIAELLDELKPIEGTGRVVTRDVGPELQGGKRKTQEGTEG